MVAGHTGCDIHLWQHWALSLRKGGFAIELSIDSFVGAVTRLFYLIQALLQAGSDSMIIWFNERSMPVLISGE